ncbi:carboxypeptidase M32 [Erysipelothrix aquatica]|uniref:carboxypeptidase M32 n=1 Tax=Erysipelothrix aquatica TaxID=2683714 RepID=UPI0013585FDF|nr:carboxypeptidase M32 [Erysipelothrix aquatica]
MNFSELNNKLNAYSLALTTMSFDAQTIAPKMGDAYRNSVMSFLSGEYFSLFTSHEAYVALTDALLNEDPIIAKSAAQMLESLNKIKDIPYDEYVAFENLKLASHNVWADSRKNKDYSTFVENLNELITSHRNVISYRPNGASIYDASLDDYEKGLTINIVDNFFTTINDKIVPFIDKVIENQAPRPAFMSAFVSISKQREISELVMTHLGYSIDFGLLGEAEHPFSSTFSINDTRITTTYHENDFTQSIFSIIHEIGHSMYNHQVNPEFEGYAIADSMSMSLHESQSRFLENMIGRSAAFWTPLYPKLQAIIPDVLGSVSLDEFIRGINFVERGAIRIEADELTYPLHILVRYNIEKLMFVEAHDAHGLDQKFADEMARILKLTPASVSEGILQDIHWSDASFGYFPTYALGTAYAAQFMAAMEKNLDVEQTLRDGNLSLIFDWLRQNIHQFGGSIETQDLILKVCGEAFNPNYYVNYLISKYSTLVGIPFE